MTLPTNMIGSIAAFSTTAAFVPQLIRVWRLKTARDISLYMFLLFSFGEGMWLIYGLLIHSMPVILANAVTLAWLARFWCSSSGMGPSRSGIAPSAIH